MISKRASLSLSVNAIVVLVLAITMLGLGLGFTRGMFSRFSSQLTVPTPDIPATADDPIALPANEIEIQRNKDAVLTVNVYNDNWATDKEINGFLKCPAMDQVDATPQMIPAGESIAFMMIIPGDSTRDISAPQVCSLRFGEGPSRDKAISKQIVIRVR